MSTRTYLSPGFYIALGNNGRILFPRFTQGLRRSDNARLAVIDALCAGYDGQLDILAQECARRIGAETADLRVFIEALEASNALTTQPPEPLPNISLDTMDAAALTGDWVLATPVMLFPRGGRYLWFNHMGEASLSLTLGEARAATLLARPGSMASALQAHQATPPAGRISAGQFQLLLARMAAAGVLVPADEHEQPAPSVSPSKQAGVDARTKIQAAVDEAVARHDVEGAQGRVPVIPVNVFHGAAPAALGILVAYAMHYEGGHLAHKFDFPPLFLADEERLLERALTPGVFLFSNYLWTVEENLRLSAAIKAANPLSVTIHGGPSTPKYEQDSIEFFHSNPHVDIAVRGEGEQTFAEVLKALNTENLLNFDALSAVEGISYRTANGTERTGDRDRIADVDSIPSPYLMGLFDAFGAGKSGAILETNRGCPFGCTFCDWGSATLSKVRKFDLQRVFAELEWCAKHQIATASFADANFGMLERDVEIARKIASLKREYGYPRTVATNYAKNNVKHLRKIIEILAEVEILTEGVVSLQSMDETTLRIIDRSNIKLEKYNDLTVEFRRANLPLAADIMMGLPGSTPASFFNDLQECTNRDVRVRANPTLLLTNSPMNNPEYRSKHGIVARPGEILQETASYTREDWRDMNELRVAFNLFDNWGVLRYVGRYVRSVTDLGEVAFYDRLRREALRNPQRWPILAATLETLEQFMAPPGSWGLFMEEVRRFLTDVLSVPDNAALETVINVQLAHLPAPDRKFPYVIQLAHDFEAWQNEVLRTRDDGHRADWERHIRALSDYGPATLTVYDPNDVCRIDLGKPMGVIAYAMRSWEMESPVTRPSLGAAA
ncbi:MAG: hypothetical protein Hals2KO_16940 [Halioglobus sp.]